MKSYIVSVGTAWGWLANNDLTTRDIGLAKQFKTIKEAWKKAIQVSAPTVYEIEVFPVKVMTDTEWITLPVPKVATPQGDR